MQSQRKILMRYSAILFDLDGTLVDSVADIAAAANAMLIKLNLSTLDVTLITSFVGKGIPNLVERCLNAALKTRSPHPELLALGLNTFLENILTKVLQDFIRGYKKV